MLRMPRGIFSAFLLPIFLLVALHFLFSSGSHINSHDLYLVIGPITMGIAMTAYDSHALGLLAARTKGVLKRLHGTPLPSWCYFTGRILATMVLCILSSVTVLVIASFLYSFNLSFPETLLIMLTVALGSLTCAIVGTAVTRFIRDASSGQTLLAATYLPLLFLSGTFSSFASEPKWVQAFAKFFPFQAISSGIQHLLTNSPLGLTTLLSYGILIIWTLLAGLTAVRTFRWE